MCQLKQVQILPTGAKLKHQPHEKTRLFRNISHSKLIYPADLPSLPGRPAPVSGVYPDDLGRPDLLADLFLFHPE